MKSFFNTVIAYFTENFGIFTKIFQWLSSGFGIQMLSSIALKSFLLIALAFFISYLTRLWTLFKDLVSQFKTLGYSANGSSYGIANSQLVTSFWGFVHASGLDDAIITSGTLFISLLSVYFAIQSYKLFYTVVRDVYSMASDGSKLLPKPK